MAFLAGLTRKKEHFSRDLGSEMLPSQ